VVAGRRTLCTSSQLTGVDQNSCLVRSLAVRQCSFSTAANEFSTSHGGFHICRHIGRIATTVSFPSSPELEERSVAEFRKNLLPVSDVAHLNRDGPWRL
jgi:hypothetical protein